MDHTRNHHSNAITTSGSSRCEKDPIRSVHTNAAWGRSVDGHGGLLQDPQLRSKRPFLRPDSCGDPHETFKV